MAMNSMSGTRHEIPASWIVGHDLALDNQLTTECATTCQNLHVAIRHESCSDHGCQAQSGRNHLECALV